MTPYPGASQIGRTSKTVSRDGKSTVTTTVYATRDPLSKVAGYYEGDKHIRMNTGWSMTSHGGSMHVSSGGSTYSGTEIGDKTAFFDRRADNVRALVRLATSSDGKTRITVTQTTPK